MSDSDSEGDAPLTRVMSAERPKEKGYDVSPIDTEYDVTIDDRKKTRFLYTLKMGKELPYRTVLEGKNKLDFQSILMTAHSPNSSLLLGIRDLGEGISFGLRLFNIVLQQSNKLLTPYRKRVHIFKRTELRSERGGLQEDAQ